MTTERITKSIDDLILDPNNYRFIDKPEYRFVPEDQVDDTRVQQRTIGLITGKNQDNIKDLITSFKANGFLDIDQIQVKKAGNKYLVLEGNRRVATLKYLWEEFKKGNDVGVLKEENFKEIHLVEITGEDPAEHLIAMGLHHISGKKRWDAVNEAQLIKDLIEKYNKTKDDICNELGITKQKLNRSLRTLSFIEQYKKSDYEDQFQANKFTIFETIINSLEMKKWLSWNDSSYKAENTENMEKLFSWMSEVEEIEEIDETEGDEMEEMERDIYINKAEGERYISKKEPIITQYRQIRELAKFINDPAAVKRMEESRSITEAYSYSDAIGKTRLENALENISKEVQVAFNFGEHLENNDYEKIEALKLKLDRLIPSNFVKVLGSSQQIDVIYKKPQKHFTKLHINRYRKIQNLEITNLSKVNIFVGANNKGKTTVLEAFYLLSQLNNLNAFLELEKFRSKTENIDPVFIDKNFTEGINIVAIFDDSQYDIKLSKETINDNDFDKTGYISTITEIAQINKDTFENKIHLFSNKDSVLNSDDKIQKLCPATFTSPYRYNSELLKTAHSSLIESKDFDKVLRFIQENLDSSIEKIELVSINNLNRFMVTSTKNDKAIDITKYGEGLQRIFEIILLMIYSEGGIICIDEIDSAIHKSLLIKFTKFIQELADQYNVQVFLTTHSKECIDAFVENKYKNNELTAFVLKEVDDKIQYKYLNGSRLEELVDLIDIDIR
jgi:hypothetical protein cbatJ_03415